MAVNQMAEYSAELREFFDQFYVNGMKSKDMIEIGRGYLFDFDYPIFSEEYRQEFETKFIRTFFLREIGFETFGLFKFKLETWLTVNMPYFNKMYESILLENANSPFENNRRNTTYTKSTSKSETKSGTVEGSTSGIDTAIREQNVDENNMNNTSGNSFNRDIGSDTPDTRLNLTTGDDGLGVIEYASRIDEQKAINATEQTNEGHTEDKTTTSGTHDETRKIDNTETKNDDEIESYTFETSGKIGIQSYAKLLKEYRESILNVDNMVFKEMQQLFMLVY